MLIAHFPRSLAGTLAAFLGTTALVFGAAAVTPARADSTVTPSDQKVIVTGAGWGHGKGMSQYGAYGAASKGLSYSQILAFYYPHTTLKGTSNKTMRVWITADKHTKLYVRPDRGLQVYDSAHHKVRLPYSSKYTKWRIARTSKGRTLQYRTRSGKWRTYRSKLNSSRQWWIRNTSTGKVRLAMSGGVTRTYPGRLALNVRSGRNVVVNYVKLETYLRTVVPSEMPSSWGSTSAKGMEALKAQAVAARTFALREKAAKPSGYGYDVCDTSSCQVYKDISYRTSNTDKAISATKGKTVLYSGKPALTQFSSSNGGWSAGYSTYPYLNAKKDPYDGVKRNQTWSKTITGSALQKAYPAIGTFRSIRIVSRTGVGPYDGKGRVTKITVTGSKGSVSVSGSSFKSRFGLKETLFAFSGKQASTSTPAPDAPAVVSTTVDAALSPADGKVIADGSGWGHGHGMSQYGAYGAAKKGLSYSQIIAFYYPGTTLKTTADQTMRVWITGATSSSLYVRPNSGLTVTDSKGGSLTLPRGTDYTKWRISRNTTTGVRTLSYRNAAGSHVAYSTSKLNSKLAWYFGNPSTGVVRLAIGGSTRTYSGLLGLDVRSGKNVTINYVNLETYLRNVIPAEMPASWSSEALKAQAVAARTFALRMKASSKSTYDLCDSSSCQVYKDNSARYSSTDTAIAKTAGKTVYYGSALALTQFSSSNGGWSASSSGYAYLDAHADPYDGVARNQGWTKTITTSAITKAYPAIGTFRSIQITKRTDPGPYNGKGRVSVITIKGSKGSVTVSGSSFKSKFGLKETLFRLKTS
ncbi:MAG TPA: hypothetical protein DCM67_00835 [Propionibacteriaceae bacterium]|nr:hypothetical protein [Propionibacteriaceae bacterium]